MFANAPPMAIAPLSSRPLRAWHANLFWTDVQVSFELPYDLDRLFLLD